MATGYTRADTTNNIADGNVISAADLDNEFDSIQAAFNEVSGHDHDGTAAGGAPINKVGPAQDVIVSTTSVVPKTNNVVDLGSSTQQFKDLWIDGAANIDTAKLTTIQASDGTAAGSIADTTGVVTLSSAVLTTADINGGTADGVTIGGTTAAAGTFTTLNASSTATLNTLSSSGATITGGTINGTTIGGTTAAAGSFTTLSATGNIAVVGTVDGRDVAADGSKLDGIEAGADVTDTTNVTAAGALMDSELVNITAVKALNQGVATTDSPSFVGATLSGGTANGVVYLNGSKVLTSGSALTYDGSALTVQGDVKAGAFVGSNQKVMLSDSPSISSLDSSKPLYITTSSGSNADLVFERNGAEQMRIGSAGVGIGTSSISAVGSRTTTHIHGSAGAAIRLSDDTGNAYIDYTDGTGSRYSVNSAEPIIFQTDSQPRLTISGSGNVGIGTSSPLSLLSVRSSTGPVLTLENSSSALTTDTVIGKVDFYANDASTNGTGVAGSIGTYSEDIYGVKTYISFATRLASNPATERLRIDSSGNLLVGTTTVGSGTYGDTNALVFYRNDGSLFVEHVTGTASGTRFVDFSYGGSRIGSISQNGTTAVAYNTSSDYRLKDNIQDITGSGAFIDALQPRSWNWKADGSAGAGFIAHELQAVSPSSVVGEKDAVDADGNPEYQAVEYGSAEVIAMLVAEVKSLRARLNAAGL